MGIAPGERGETGDPSLCDDGLGVSPALRRRASALFDQQMWCWGQDVRHHGGDVLVRYGFFRWRTPPHQRGCHAYTLDLGPSRRLTLWGFGLVYGEYPDGAVFLKRFEFAPRWRIESNLPCPAWSLAELPCFLSPEDKNARDRARRLTAAALEVVASYEEWVFEAIGADYRRQCVGTWSKTRISAERIAPSWRCLTRRIRRTTLPRSPVIADPAQIANEGEDAH
jgi:hypothetical protein